MRVSESQPIVWPSPTHSYITPLPDPTKGHWNLCFYISDSIFYFSKGLVWGLVLGTDSKEVISRWLLKHQTPELSGERSESSHRGRGWMGSISTSHHGWSQKTMRVINTLLQASWRGSREPLHLCSPTYSLPGAHQSFHLPHIRALPRCYVTPSLVQLQGLPCEDPRDFLGQWGPEKAPAIEGGWLWHVCREVVGWMCCEMLLLLMWQRTASPVFWRPEGPRVEGHRAQRWAQAEPSSWEDRP